MDWNRSVKLINNEVPWFKLQIQSKKLKECEEPRTFSSEMPLTRIPLWGWCRPSPVLSPSALLLAFQPILSEQESLLLWGSGLAPLLWFTHCCGHPKCTLWTKQGYRVVLLFLSGSSHNGRYTSQVQKHSWCYPQAPWFTSDLLFPCHRDAITAKLHNIISWQALL